jgi:hypothetical protein
VQRRERRERRRRRPRRTSRSASRRRKKSARRRHGADRRRRDAHVLTTGCQPLREAAPAPASSSCSFWGTAAPGHWTRAASACRRRSATGTRGRERPVCARPYPIDNRPEHPPGGVSEWNDLRLISASSPSYGGRESASMNAQAASRSPAVRSALVLVRHKRAVGWAMSKHKPTELEASETCWRETSHSRLDLGGASAGSRTLFRGNALAFATKQSRDEPPL